MFCFVQSKKGNQVHNLQRRVFTSSCLVACGQSHAAAITNGSLYTWGRTKEGRSVSTLTVILLAYIFSNDFNSHSLECTSFAAAISFQVTLRHHNINGF